MTTSNITVNGEPLEQFVDQQRSDEIAQLRDSEVADASIRLPRGRSKISRNLSGARTSRGAVVYKSGQLAQNIIIAGNVYPWLSKAPYVASGMSAEGCIECNEDQSKIRCHECGEWFACLGQHIKVHGIKQREYKRRHSLRRVDGLMAPSMLASRKQQLVSAAHARKAPRNMEAAHIAKAAPTFKASKRKPLLNIAGKCLAQIKTDIVGVSKELGRTATRKDIRRMRGKKISDTKALFGLSWRQIVMSCGLVPSSTRPVKKDFCKYGHKRTIPYGNHDCRECAISRARAAYYAKRPQEAIA